MITNESPRSAVVELAADVVVFRGTQVLVIRRGGHPNEPYARRQALPGGAVDEGETSRIAASRELWEETQIAVPPQQLRRVDVYDAVDRDTRGRVVSVAYAVQVPADTKAMAGSDADKAHWVDISQIDTADLAFDHAAIVMDAAWMLRNGWLDLPWGAATPPTDKWGHGAEFAAGGACDSTGRGPIGTQIDRCAPCSGSYGTHHCWHGTAIAEGVVHGPRGPIATVWLADRICRVRCTCDCRVILPVQPTLF